VGIDDLAGRVLDRDAVGDRLQDEVELATVEDVGHEVDRIPSFRDHRTVRASVIATVLVASACFSPDIPSGLVACGPRGECPSDLTCSGGMCVSPGGGGRPDAPIIIADAAADAFAGPDADNERPLDAPPD